MPRGTVEEETWPYEEGWYRMRLQSVVLDEREFTYESHHAAVRRGDARAGEKGTVRSWKWHMTFAVGEYAGRKFQQDTFPRISNRDGDRARILYEAFLGRPLELGEAYDTDLVEGREADLHLERDLETERRRGKKFMVVTEGVPAGAAPEPTERWTDGPQDPWTQPAQPAQPAPAAPPWQDEPPF